MCQEVDFHHVRVTGADINKRRGIENRSIKTRNTCKRLSKQWNKIKREPLTYTGHFFATKSKQTLCQVKKKKGSHKEMSSLSSYQHMNHYYFLCLNQEWSWTFLICSINPWLDSWECFMCARSASQGWGSRVWSSDRTKGLHFGSWVRRENHTTLSGPFPCGY